MCVTEEHSSEVPSKGKSAHLMRVTQPFPLEAPAITEQAKESTKATIRKRPEHGQPRVTSVSLPERLL